MRYIVQPCLIAAQKSLLLRVFGFDEATDHVLSARDIWFKAEGSCADGKSRQRPLQMTARCTRSQDEEDSESNEI